jgi:hypothetical protein
MTSASIATVVARSRSTSYSINWMIQYFLQSSHFCVLRSCSFANSRSFLIYSTSNTRSYFGFSSNSDDNQRRNRYKSDNTRVAAPGYSKIAQRSFRSALSPSRALPENTLSGAIRSTLIIFSHLKPARQPYLHRSHSLSSAPAVYINSSSPCRLRHSYALLLTTSAAPTLLTTIHKKPLTSCNMASKPSEISSDSSLSPPPDNLVSATETAVDVQPVVNSKQRKAETTSRNKRTATQLADPDDDAAAVTNESPRPKRRAVKKVKVTEEALEDTPVEVSASARPKRGAAKKAVIEDEIMEGEFDVPVSRTKIDRSKNTTDNKAIDQKPSKSKKRKAEDDDDHEEKPKSAAKKRANTVKRDKNEKPIAGRTQNIPHIIGAHVSTAGGTSSTCSAYCLRRPKTNMDWTTVV